MNIHLRAMAFIFGDIYPKKNHIYLRVAKPLVTAAKNMSGMVQAVASRLQGIIFVVMVWLT